MVSIDGASKRSASPRSSSRFQASCAAILSASSPNNASGASGVGVSVFGGSAGLARSVHVSPLSQGYSSSSCDGGPPTPFKASTSRSTDVLITSSTPPIVPVDGTISTSSSQARASASNRKSRRQWQNRCPSVRAFDRDSNSGSREARKTIVAASRIWSSMALQATPACSKCFKSLSVVQTRSAASKASPASRWFTNPFVRCAKRSPSSPWSVSESP